MSDRAEIKALFGEAMDRAPEARRAFLASRTAGRPDLRREVEDLLARAEVDETVASPDRMPAAPEEDAPPSIEGYAVERRLGRGGFGAVYEAIQESPVRRRVAVKVLHSELRGASVLRRFAFERRALERMDHPGIARILDAGAARDGRPWVAMELIDGRPINAYCDEERLSVAARLELFERVGLAVVHAHRRGIIHRDLKPSNVLVTEVDGRPEPKIIDFGIAKAVTGDGTSDETAGANLTLEHHVIGSPAWMSPEQARGATADLDTRADVYALGVILFELLTGTTPLDRWRRGAGATPDLEPSLRREAPRPSTCITDVEATTIAAARGTTPPALRRALRGELDWIADRALRPDREERYDSVLALVRDVRHALDGRPVLAAPPSAVYRLRRFAARHRTAVAAAAIVLVALTIAGAGALWGALEARRAADETATVNAFVTEVITSARPDRAGADVLLIDVVDDAMERVGTRFAGQPRIELGVREMIGDVLLSQAHHDRAIAVLEPARAIAIEELGPDDPRTLGIGYRLMLALGAHEASGRAIALAEELVPRFERTLGEADSRTLDARRVLALVAAARGERDEAEAMLRSIRALARRELGHDHRVTLRSTGALIDVILRGNAGRERGHEAVALIEDALPHVESRGSELLSISFRAQAAQAYVLVGRLDEAIALAESVLEDAGDTLSEAHPLLTSARRELAEAWFATGDVSRAADLVLRNVEVYAARGGDGHPVTMSARDGALPILLAAGAWRDAANTARALLPIAVEHMGESAPSTTRYRAALAWALAGLGETDGAREALAALPSERTDETSAFALAARSQLHEFEGDPGAAETSLLAALDLVRDGATLRLREDWLLDRLATLADARSDDEAAADYRRARDAVRSASRAPRTGDDDDRADDEATSPS